MAPPPLRLAAVTLLTGLGLWALIASVGSWPLAPPIPPRTNATPIRHEAITRTPTPSPTPLFLPLPDSTRTSHLSNWHRTTLRAWYYPPLPITGPGIPH